MGWVITVFELKTTHRSIEYANYTQFYNMAKNPNLLTPKPPERKSSKSKYPNFTNITINLGAAHKSSSPDVSVGIDNELQRLKIIVTKADNSKYESSITLPKYIFENDLAGQVTSRMLVDSVTGNRVLKVELPEDPNIFKSCIEVELVKPLPHEADHKTSTNLHSKKVQKLIEKIDQNFKEKEKTFEELYETKKRLREFLNSPPENFTYGMCGFHEAVLKGRIDYKKASIKKLVDEIDQQSERMDVLLAL